MGVSFVLAAVMFVTTAGAAFAWDASAFSAADEGLLFSLTNQDRVSAGLNALVDDSYLHAEAEWRAQDMGDRDYFSHQIPPGNDMVFAYMQNDGYCFNVAGENIGLSTYGDDAATNRIEIAFMNSAGHRANILGSWAHMGVGAYKAADGRKLYTVLFSVPCGVTVPTPVPVVTPAPPVGPTPEPTVATPPQPTVVPPPKPTAKATPKATARPVATASPTDLPSAAPSETLPASPTPTFTIPASSASPFVSPNLPGAGTTPTSPGATSLRVYEKPVSPGPIDSLFRSLFGGLFGW